MEMRQWREQLKRGDEVSLTKRGRTGFAGKGVVQNVTKVQIEVQYTNPVTHSPWYYRFRKETGREVGVFGGERTSLHPLNEADAAD